MDSSAAAQPYAGRSALPRSMPRPKRFAGFAHVHLPGPASRASQQVDLNPTRSGFNEFPVQQAPGQQAASGSVRKVFPYANARNPPIADSMPGHMRKYLSDKVLGSHQPLQLRNDLEEVADQSHIGDFKYGRFAILVDRDNGPGILDAGQMLNRSGDADCEIDLR